MSRYFSHISSATSFIEAYRGEEPFVHFLRKQFSANKKYGSRDRKSIASLCYYYFRTAHAFGDDPTQEKILKGLFLCESQSNALLEALKPGWNQRIGLTVTDKLEELSLQSSALFPFGDALSDAIDQKAFAESFLRQPLLFLRTRPGKKQRVLTSLNAASIPYSLMDEHCVALQNATTLDKVLRLNKDAVVQDYNSQKVFNTAIESGILPLKTGKADTWDCCAASGGKSVLLYDKLDGSLKLTVSDIRPSILANLKKRLQEATIPIYKTFIADLALEAPKGINDPFDVIICDAPCTGSGTWSRTPEQLFFFTTPLIETYAAKQKKIAGNALTLLKKDGLFFYITCSVFKKENEEVVSFLQQQQPVELVSMEYLKGYGIQADTMFVALFRK
jgi:16S rRNA (cytosine967-C5)-methyltransferase